MLAAQIPSFGVTSSMGTTFVFAIVNVMGGFGERSNGSDASTVIRGRNVTIAATPPTMVAIPRMLAKMVENAVHRFFGGMGSGDRSPFVFGSVRGRVFCIGVGTRHVKEGYSWFRLLKLSA
jgi:hypothetical protein